MKRQQVGPHEGPSSNPFWNAPFGADRTWREVTTAGQAVTFFRATRSVLGL